MKLQALGNASVPFGRVAFGRVHVDPPDIQAQPNDVGRVQIVGETGDEADTLVMRNRVVARGPGIAALSKELSEDRLKPGTILTTIMQGLNPTKLNWIKDLPGDTHVPGQMKADMKVWFERAYGDGTLLNFLRVTGREEAEGAQRVWTYKPQPD